MVKEETLGAGNGARHQPREQQQQQEDEEEELQWDGGVVAAAPTQGGANALSGNECTRTSPRNSDTDLSNSATTTTGEPARDDTSSTGRGNKGTLSCGGNGSGASSPEIATGAAGGGGILFVGGGNVGAGASPSPEITPGAADGGDILSLSGGGYGGAAREASCLDTGNDNGCKFTSDHAADRHQEGSSSAGSSTGDGPSSINGSTSDNKSSNKDKNDNPFELLSPERLSSFDIVLTTFDVLRAEVHHADSRFAGSGGRGEGGRAFGRHQSLRQTKRYNADVQVVGMFYLCPLSQRRLGRAVVRIYY